MDVKKNFELNDDDLDTVSGGAGNVDFSKCPFPNNARIRNTRRHCARCELGGYSTPHYEAEVHHINSGSYKGTVLINCTRCNNGFYGNTSCSVFTPWEAIFDEWTLA